MLHGIVKNFLLCLSGGLLVSLLSGTACAGQFNQVMSIGDAMPAFKQLPAVDGETYDDADFDADILVLVTMSNACPFSTGIEKDLIALVDDAKGLSVDIVAISYNLHKLDRMPAMKTRYQEHGFNFPYLRDDSQELGRALGTTVTPEFFVFNKARKLVYMGLLHNSPAMQQGERQVYMRGEPNQFYVADAIQAIQNKKAKKLKTKETRPYGCTVEYDNRKK